MSDDNSKNKQPKLAPPSGSLASSMMLPKSSLLSRLGDFLPQLQAANKNLENVENKESLRVDLQMESDNEEDGSDSNENDGDDEGNSSGQKEADGDDFLIRERPAHAAPETAENEKDDNHAQEEDPEKSCQNPTIELKISLGDFGGPVMDLLGASDAPNPEASCEEEQDDNSQASAKEAGISNLLLNGKRKHESLTQKPKGPLITELS